MRLPLAASLLLVTVVLAGCVSSPGADVGSSGLPDTDLTGKARQDALWDNPQTFPHPAFDWPTVTHPPANASNPWLAPIDPAELPDEIAGVEHRAQVPGQARSGAGIAIVGSLAVVPAWSGPTTIFDISDPTDPKKLSTIDDVARDADTIVTPDGRIVAVFATDNEIVPVWDLTDPTEPEKLAEIQPTDGSHNVGVVPGTPILYNANSAGGKAVDAQLSPFNGQGITEIYDLSDPAEPELIQDWKNGYGCHDISFHLQPSADFFRAYCAGIEYTQIWDIADPRHPEVITSIPVHHGDGDLPSLAGSAARFSHLAMVNQDASILIVGDETGGGLAPACDAYAHAAGRTASGPLGNLYFYDISNERSPELLGWMSPSHHYPTNPPTGDEGGFGAAGCTAHFGRLIPQEDRDLLAMSWYGAGVTLIDFTDAANPVIVDQWNDNTNTWDTWYYNGYLFTGDMSRGMDVFTLR